MLRTALPSLLALLATSAASQPRPTAPIESLVSCGGITDVGTIARYFSDLQEALAKTGPKTRFNMFVDDEFGVRSKQGHTLYFRVRDIRSVTPGRISISEWQEISKRGAASLQNAGWPGCFLDNGKVRFVGSKEGGFRLTLIAKGMPWVRPEKGDVIP
jgi:hypothetical protein